MPRIVTAPRPKLSSSQIGLLERIDRAEGLTKRDVNALRSLEHRFIIKLRRPGHETYPLDPVEYVVTERGRALFPPVKPDPERANPPATPAT